MVKLNHLWRIGGPQFVFAERSPINRRHSNGISNRGHGCPRESAGAVAFYVTNFTGNFMGASVEETAIGMLSAVMNLYGAEAYAEIVAAFRCALSQQNDEAVAATLCEALLEVIRNRTNALTKTR